MGVTAGCQGLPTLWIEPRTHTEAAMRWIPIGRLGALLAALLLATNSPLAAQSSERWLRAHLRTAHADSALVRITVQRWPSISDASEDGGTGATEALASTDVVVGRLADYRWDAVFLAAALTTNSPGATLPPSSLPTAVHPTSIPLATISRLERGRVVPEGSAHGLAGAVVGAAIGAAVGTLFCRVSSASECAYGVGPAAGLLLGAIGGKVFLDARAPGGERVEFVVLWRR